MFFVLFVLPAKIMRGARTTATAVLSVLGNGDTVGYRPGVTQCCTIHAVVKVIPIRLFFKIENTLCS